MTGDRLDAFAAGDLADSAPFDAGPRLAELRGITGVQAVIERASSVSGRVPGLFLDEDDRIEARWVIPVGAASSRVVNVTFGNGIDVYVYDRSASKITTTEHLAPGTEDPGARIAALIGHHADDEITGCPS